MTSTSFEEAGIPQELIALSHWVNWRLAGRPAEGKTSKVPYDPKDPRKKASTQDPTTWGTFHQAAKVARSDGAYGIGYVLTKDDGLAGIDLDYCRDAETGEIEGWALDVLKLVDSYSEISPSGTGIHILAYGEKPGSNCRKGNLEMYSSGRYFTVTGLVVRSSIEGQPVTTIKERPEQIARVYFQYLEAEIARLGIPIVLEDERQRREVSNGSSR